LLGVEFRFGHDATPSLLICSAIYDMSNHIWMDCSNWPCRNRQK
jgi:hypothetical protein